MWVPGFGVVDCRPSRLPPVRRPDPFPTYVDDPEGERARIAERVAERMRVEPPWPGYPVWPAPEVPMRVVEAGSTPSAPRGLLSKLRSAEWRVVVTYARGRSFNAQRRPGRVTDSWAVRAALGARRAVGVWTGPPGGKLTSGGVLVFGDVPARWIGVQEFERGL